MSPDDAARRAAIGRVDAETRAASAQDALVQSGVNLLPTWGYFCDAFLCEAVHDDVGQYFDNNHLTNSAARRIRAVLEPVFRKENR